jgi:magnesium-transporting ATPase (P-type)
VNEDARPRLPKLRVNRSESNAAVQRLTDRLGVWLVLGNAAGLILCFNAVLDRRICDWDAFRGTAILFGIGAVGVVLAHAFSAQAHSLAVAIEARDGMIKNLDIRAAQSEGRITRTLNMVRNGLFVLALFGYVLGFAMVVVAPLKFLLDPSSPSILCSKDA